MFYRNRLLLGIVKTVVSTVGQVLYGVICFLNLQLTLIVILLWILLHFTGVTEKYSISTAILSIAFAGSLVYAVLTSIKKLLGLDGQPRKRIGAQTVKDKGADNEKKEDYSAQPSEYRDIEQKVEPSGVDDYPIKEHREDKPRYYRVKQNSSLIMAEYLDRYELYRVADGKLIKLRTDYKN